MINKKSNLIELDPNNYSLKNVEEPNLIRDIFDYNGIPKISFNHCNVPVNMPEKIWITDTTFRDGQQSRPPYTAKQIVDLYKLLSRLGGTKGIIRQTEFFVYSKKDRQAINDCMELGYDFPEITTWIRAKKQDFQLLKDIGIVESGILVSCSDYHIFKKLKMNRKQAINHYMSVVSDMIDYGIKPRCHFEDITRADFYGFVLPFVIELKKLSEKTNIPIKIRACDTLGYGIPHSGVSLPRSVPGIIHGLHYYAKIPSELIEWHGHNDFYKGVANASAAWLYGASAVNCSLLGIGERTGNVPIEAMVFEYASLRGDFDGMDPTVITEIAEYYKTELGYKIPPMTPFVGENFNVTKAGIHADGLLKDEEIYNIFNTSKFLNRPATVAVSNTSGFAGIAYWINTYFKLSEAEKLTKQDTVVIIVKKWVDDLYDNGRVTFLTDEELSEFVTSKTDLFKG